MMILLLLCQTRLNGKILCKRSRDVPKGPVGIREGLRKALLQLRQEPLAVEIAFANAGKSGEQATIKVPRKTKDNASVCCVGYELGLDSFAFSCAQST